MPGELSSWPRAGFKVSGRAGGQRDCSGLMCTRRTARTA